MKLEQALKKYWGYSTFRPFQREAVDSVLKGRDAMVVLPTGGGKSLCYQLPAACGIGLVLVVSPLIALMDDQVQAARDIGLRAGALHSQTNEKTRQKVNSELHSGGLDLLYVSPERLVVSSMLESLRSRLGLFAIDEAHCVSHWGHEFRPEYRKLGSIFREFPEVPRMALTATATPPVQTDIREQLGLRNSISLIGHPDRPNLIYRAFPRFDQSRQVLEVIRRHPGEGGIVYAQTRREVDRLAKSLAKAGVSCAPYHAGLNGESRAKAQKDFVNENLDVVVATIAFGMGIDRSNVRYVVHANTPKSVEHYQQESGRAGRDGEPAECVLFFSISDLITHRTLSFRDEGITPERRNTIERQLKEIGRYAISPVCRHRLLSEHFGQKYPPVQEQKSDDSGNLPSKDGGPSAQIYPTKGDVPANRPDGDVLAGHSGCGACDVCLGETKALPEAEALLTAQKIISAVYRTESRFGATYVVKVLLGSPDPRISRNGHDTLRVFGLMKESTENAIRSWIDQLIVQGHLGVTEGEYPLLQVTKSGLNVCKGLETVRLGLPAPKPPKDRKRRGDKALSAPGSGPAIETTPLFESLRRLRLLLARMQGYPPYLIFPDSVLASMSLFKPASLENLRMIKGIGDRKLERYGRVFLDVIQGKDPEATAATFSI